MSDDPVVIVIKAAVDVPEFEFGAEMPDEEAAAIANALRSAGLILDPGQVAADDRVNVIAAVLMWNMNLTDGDVWEMDDDSPRSMAEKIVRALDGGAPDA